MLALVATPRFLLLVDIDRRSAIPIESGRPEYYGISWGPTASDLTLSHSGLDHESLTDLAAYAASEVGWISSGRTESPPFLSAPHQILCGSDGRVICANTGRNCVTVIDPQRPGLYQEGRVGSARWDRLSAADHSGMHVNSVWESDGRLYVVAHGFERGSQLAVFRYPTLELIALEPLADVSGIHNYCITSSGDRISCHSATGSLVDPHDGRVLWRSGTAGYLRGLAVGPQAIIVGDSPKLPRGGRSAADGGLWVIDRKTWRVRDYLCLGPYGVVNEVRLLDEPDEAHHGVPFAGVKGLLSRDDRRDRSAERLAVARRAEEAERSLPFDRVLGTPEIDAQGRWVAGEDLCLIVTREHSPEQVAFAYDFSNADAAAHCSLVIGYRGPAAPTNGMSVNDKDAGMDALLINRGHVHAPPVLSHWRHDGVAWKCVESGICEVPLSGRVVAERQGGDVIVTGADGMRFGFPLERFMRPDLSWGCRWYGMSIIPSAPPP
jgi:hypothetical protein